ncbi:MAG: HAMP domain-containing histidine kinase [Planctomycetes bacterium]|nr:HAMP domain-containing histidine kinase [Planctomycetota bacterium]
MSSATDAERPDAPSGSARPERFTTVREFLHALGQRFTYNPRRNAYALFGFLWGLPVPVFSVGIDQWASGQATQHPIHIAFLMHPLLFAVIFGAMGTVRHRKDLQIHHLVEELKRHAQELGLANERLTELDRMKAQFMANVTHELKTPLVAIRGYNESILEERFGPLTDKQRQGLGIAVRNVDRLQKLIEELLEFERIDSGDFKLQIADFDLVPLVQSALENFRPQVDEKKLATELHLPEKLEVRADREKIAHVLQNLISNAVKFSPDGSAIGVTASTDASLGRASLTVWDRGPGIPSAAQKFLFTRFWQADGSSRRKHGGTGLGLAICKGILDAHRAPIQVVSSEGNGTKVHFSLTLAKECPHDREAAHSHRGR